MSFKILCLFIILGITIAGNVPMPPPPMPDMPDKPDDDVNYCSTLYPECPEFCPAIYDPVCAKYQVPCLYGVCPPAIYVTYPSACVACQDPNVVSYRHGTCEECEEEVPEEEEYPEEEECEEEEEEYEEEDCECEEEEEKHFCKKAEHYGSGKKVACTQEYNPVCGYFKGCPNGKCYETFPNGCVACYYGCADYYIEGECPKSKHD